MNIDQQAVPADNDDFAADVMETLGFSSGDDTNPLDAIGNNEPQAGEAAPSEAGAGVDAPSPAPVTPPAPASEAPATPAAPEPASPAPAEQPPAAQPPQPAAPPAQPVVDERALREQSLAAQVEALQAQIAELRSQPQSGQPPAAPESGVPQLQIEPYRLTLPEPMQQALESDDPATRLRGITVLANDLANTVMPRRRVAGSSDSRACCIGSGRVRR